MAREISVRFTEPQLWAHNALRSREIGKSTIVALPWGRSTGKSEFMRLQLHLFVAENFGKLRTNAPDPFRGVRIIGLCPTLKQFRDVHAAKLDEGINGKWKPFGGKLNHSSLRIDWPDGSWFQPLPAANATAKAGLGMRADMVFIDECDDVSIRVYDTVVRPWLKERWSHKRIFCGGTPRNGRNGLLWKLHSLGLSEDPKHARYFSRITTYRDCPDLIDPEAIEEDRGEMGDELFSQEYEVNFDSASGLVFPGFDPAFHVREPPGHIHFHRYVLGVDHGTEHPGAMILVGISGYGDSAIAWVLEEDVASHRDNPIWDQIARTKYAPRAERAYADPSRPDRIADLRRAGLNMQPADNSVAPGLGRIAGLLMKQGRDLDNEGRKIKQWARLYVHPKCGNTIAGFLNYKRKPDNANPGKFLDDVIKLHDDEMDALRYALMGEFGPYAGFGRHVVDDA